MNYVQVTAHRDDSPTIRATAHVLIDDRELFDLLDGAVAFLGHMGWVADNLEQFLINVQQIAVENKEQVQELWHQAETDGIACLLEPANSGHELEVNSSEDLADK